MNVRLQKHIADLGICSRRKAEALIAAGKVKVNGSVIKEMGMKINPETDVVEVSAEKNERRTPRHDSVGMQARGPKSPVYIALHKPIDYISSASSAQGKSVIDLLTPDRCVSKNQRERARRSIAETRVYPVGRLDKDSEGLMLLTNDGEITNTLTHPKYEHEKEYEVSISTPLSKEARQVLNGGMRIGDDHVRGIHIKKELRKGKRVVITVILKEGKNRQIRKMFGALGYTVLELKRTRIGNLTLGTLPVGRWRYVSKDAIFS